MTECNCLVVVIRTYNFQLDAVAHKLLLLCQVLMVAYVPGRYGGVIHTCAEYVLGPQVVGKSERKSCKNCILWEPLIQVRIQLPVWLTSYWAAWPSLVSSAFHSYEGGRLRRPISVVRDLGSRTI
jgi:hypothetical protein